MTHLDHLQSGDLDPDNCAECEAVLDRLVANAVRWTQALVLCGN